MGLAELNINPINTNAKTQSKSNQQRFEDAVIDYSNTTGRTPPSKADIKDAATLLQKGTLTIKDLAKSLFLSQNSQDIEALAQLVKQTGLLSDPAPTPQGQIKPSTAKPTNNKAAIAASSENAQGMQNLNITTTLVENQIILGHIINLIKTGSSKQAYETASSDPDLFNSVLETFGKQNQADQLQLRSMLGFLAAMAGNISAHKPEVLSQARRLYSRLQKELEELEETDSDESTLSEQAKQFMGDLRNLSGQLQQLNGEWPKDVQDSYKQLVDLLGIDHG